MSSLLLGSIVGSHKPFRFPLKAFETHLHLIGGTGKGKTTAIHTLLHPLLSDPIRRPCVVLIDRLGGLSRDLLLWMSSPFCPRHVRDRLVYFEPAREDVVLGFNPLLHGSRAEGYYKVAHAADVVLRGWSAQNIAEMPRLARWLFNALWAAAQLGLAVADCVHLLLPGSSLHAPILRALPEALRLEWAELLQAKGGEVGRILESSRNRLKPVWESDVLRHTFSSTENRLDVRRFMREGRILVANLAPYNRVPEQMADMIGGLIVHEVLTTARSLPARERKPTYLILDEFQRFVGPDLEAAIPEVRQLGVRLVLSHQSFSQLERGETDLSSLIWQCQSRITLGVQGEDAELLAHEMASLTYDPRKIKDELFGRRQRVSGHRVIELQNHSYATQEADNWSEQFGQSTPWALSMDSTRGPDGTRSQQEGKGKTRSSTSSTSVNQSMLPVYEEFTELMSRTYVTFDEDRNEYARDVRTLPKGTAFVRLVDDPGLYRVQIKRDAPGHLAMDANDLDRFYPRALEELDALVAQNFAQDIFCTPAQIERETRERLDRVLRPAIQVWTRPAPPTPQPDAGSPFT